MAAVELTLTERITNLLYDYVEAIDDGRLEAWPELFVDDCVYKIVSRENSDRGRDLPLVYCDGIGMLRDRINVFRNALIYSYRFDRHLLSNVRVVDQADGVYRVRAHFSVFKTDPEGQTEVFCAGRYDDRVVIPNGTPKFKEKIVILDTFNVPNMIQTPL